ncbi:TPA: HK97 gp10 family phage protein [Streptococcus pyogenes]|nr:HK97 gp10 family phage protein [Streptococcus pyogenes]HER4721132.1 HK97 gp10 family phage protein [Streptococcus pyogenes NGAS308]HER4769044.1 HK97 gp10 family phage protein [Streptococcus pyogenes NGAS209]HER0750253.1 HK97 gp10 family phage protein [Streptococcus pyogenes]HER1130885.1 HK97 gp10 family phage protein [Streptococcus pyogenes]
MRQRYDHDKWSKHVMTKVAKEFEKTLKSNTPVYEIETDERLQEDTVISGFKGSNVGIVSKEIGYGKATGWRAHYPNDGTIYQRGQDFKERTINQMTPRARQIYAEKVKEGLGL